MRSAKVFLAGICAVTATALAMACGGSTTDSGGGNEGDSGSSSGGSSGSSSGGGDATSSSSSGSGSGSSSGTGGSSGSSSGGSMGDGGLTCTPTSCGAGGLCCVSGGGGGGVTSMCVTASTCPTGSRELCDPNNPMCPPGEMCRARMGSMYGTCRTPFDGGTFGDGGGPTEAGTD